MLVTSSFPVVESTRAPTRLTKDARVSGGSDASARGAGAATRHSAARVRQLRIRIVGSFFTWLFGGSDSMQNEPPTAKGRAATGCASRFCMTEDAEWRKR